MQRRRLFNLYFVCALMVFVLLLSACENGKHIEGGGSERSNETKAEISNNSPTEMLEAKQEVSLSFYNNIGVPDSYYTDYIETHINHKFPHITMQYLNSGAEGNTMRDLVVAQKIPDIILTTNNNMLNYIDMDALQPLDHLIKNNDIDISVFREDMIKALQAYDPEGQLFALPWTYGTYALYYNKEIFDQFGVDYPEDGMTWDDPQLRSMVERLSRTVDGVRYRGLEINLGMIGVNPLSLSWIDAEALTATVNTNQWQSFLQTLQGFYQISGNEKPDDTTLDGRKAFSEQRNVAMWAGNAIYPILIDLEKEGNGFDWDIVSLPTFKEAPNLGVQYQGALYNISSTTKHPDVAMQVISHLTSAEVQIEGGSLLRYPTLNDPEVQAAFGKGDRFLESKNMSALHINQIAPSPTPTKYDNVTRNLLYEKIHPLMKGQINDINTALREAEEVINQKLAEEKAKASE